jgi:aromatic-L-amino-acid decarboxylase
VAVGAPATTRAHVERVWALLCENHAWLAADFAEIAAQRERAEAERRAEIERELAEKAEKAEKEKAEKEKAERERVDVDVPAAQDETAEQAAADAP